MSRAVVILAAIGYLGSLLQRTILAGLQETGEAFFHPEGFLLTNEHVIKNAKEVEVVTSEGRTLPARVVREDAYKDLALIKVDVVNSPYLLWEVGGHEGVRLNHRGGISLCREDRRGIVRIRRKGECHSRIWTHSDASN